MDCFVGASTGALKGISFKENSFHNLNAVTSLNPKCDEITSMCWTDDSQTELLTAQMNKQLKLYSTETSACKPLFTLQKGVGAVKGIHKTANDTIVTAVESGELCVARNTGEIVKELIAGQDLQVMVPDAGQEGVYATGGKENPLKVWAIETSEKTFVAKNVKPDELQLRVPVWETDIRFLPQSHNIVTTTGEHQIRLYDPRAQRRPVREFEWLGEPITALSLCRKDMHVIVGNTRGEMGLFDLRNRINFVSKFKAFAGAITAIDAHHLTDYVASCSLDRFVHLHDISTKKSVNKVYCKARLNRLLLRNKLPFLHSDSDSEKEIENYEETWRAMKTNDDDVSDSVSQEGSVEGTTLSGNVKPSEKRKLKRKANEDEDAKERKKKNKLVRGVKRQAGDVFDDASGSSKKKKVLKPDKREDDREYIGIIDEISSGKRISHRTLQKLNRITRTEVVMDMLKDAAQLESTIHFQPGVSVSYPDTVADTTCFSDCFT